ncbi:hypothetical protein [Mycobacterium sp. URHB0021]|jgi:hypothetical protein
MPRRDRRLCVAAAGCAVAIVSASATAAATPVGPCAEVPYVGVCVPVSEQPSPSTQHTFGDVVVAPAPGGGVGIQTVN